jgi:hypothetical protein
MEKYDSLADCDVLSYTESWVRKVKSSVRDSAPYLRLLEVSEGMEESNMVGNINTIVSIGVRVRIKGYRECTLGDDSHGIAYRQLTYDEMKQFHLKMATEVIPPLPYERTAAPSGLLSSDITSSTPKLPELNDFTADAHADAHAAATAATAHADAVRVILGTKIMLGQPVKLADSVDGDKIATVVRIALGATMVTAAVGSDCPYVRAKEVTRMELEDVLVVKKMSLLAMYWEDIVAKVPSPLSPPLSSLLSPSLSLSVTRTPISCSTIIQEPELHGMTHR